MDADGNKKQDKKKAEAESDRKENLFTTESKNSMKPVVSHMADARRAHKESQDEIAAKLNVTVDYIGKVEQNRVKLPAYVLQKYCQEYDLSADELFKLSRSKDIRKKIDAVEDTLNRLPDDYIDVMYDIVELYWGYDKYSLDPQDENK